MVETLQQKARRMMASQCTDGCKDCPSNATCLIQVIAKTPSIEEQIDSINKWAIENPIRSYYEVFHERFPHAPLKQATTPVACVYEVFNVVNEDRRNHPVTCDGQCTLCWSSQYKERCAYYVNGKCWGTKEQETCYSDGKLENCTR